MIELTEDMFIGKGTQKAVYAYPGDNIKCIKIKIIDKNTDMEKELKYRAALKRRRQHKSMLPEYYGSVLTNGGGGHVFELVRDFDGQRSRELDEYLRCPELAEQLLCTDLASLLGEFKKEFLKEMIVTSDMDPRNFLVQRIAEGKYRIRVVDNIGTPVMIALAYWFDYFAKKRAERYWTRFVKDLQRKYPCYHLEDLAIR